MRPGAWRVAGDMRVRPLDFQQHMLGRVHGKGQRFAVRTQVALRAFCALVAHAADEPVAAGALCVVALGRGCAALRGN